MVLRDALLVTLAVNVRVVNAAKRVEKMTPVMDDAVHEVHVSSAEV